MLFSGYMRAELACSMIVWHMIWVVPSLTLARSLRSSYGCILKISEEYPTIYFISNHLRALMTCKYQPIRKFEPLETMIEL